MKIALIAGPYIPIPPPKYGGVELVINNLVNGLNEAGHTPILLGAADSTANCEIIPIVDKAIYFPKTKAERAEHAKLIAKANRATTRALRSLLPDIDIIHSHGFDLTPFKDFPGVTTLHNLITFGELNYFLQRKDLPYVSISTNQQIICPELNYVGMVYNGENPDDFQVVDKPDDYVCFMGRFDRDKNPHLAIELALQLGIKIKLAGKIDFRSEGYFEEEVAKYFDHPLVEYLGELGLTDKAELLSRAKCNLHPTNFREPFGLTVLEAAYCGTPTLAIARGSMPELIEPGRTGLLVEDFLEGRTKIEECFDMDRRYIAMRARQLFNYQNMSLEYVDIYQMMIRQTKLNRKVHPGLLKKFVNFVRNRNRFQTT